MAPWQNDDTIKIQFDFGVIDAFTLRAFDEDDALLQSVSFSLQTGTVYAVSFVPSNYSIEDTVIRLSIFQNSTELFKSDKLDIRETQDETVLITYSDNKNFASINYTSLSPDPEFYLRIPARFLHERFPQESEQLELSSSRMIPLNSMIKAQRKLEVQHIPTYMHRKIILALRHQFVEIDNQDWILEEAYQINEGSNKRFLLKTADAWLTEKDYFIRNVL